MNNFCEIVTDLVNGPLFLSGCFNSEVYFEVLEEGYQLVKVNGVWMLVDAADEDLALWF